jgi:predicted metal-binding protein
MNIIKVQTPKNNFNIEVYSNFINVKEIESNKALFTEMCKSGCKNFGKKYSCPPFSPSFNSIFDGYEKLFVLMFLCNLSQINSTEYNKLRIANVVMKSKIEKIMRELEKINNSKFLSTGSCRLCKPCKAKLNQPCKHPEKRRYSLESIGINCNTLIKKVFEKELKWFKEGKSPEYTCVICGLLCNKENEEKIKKELKILIIPNSLL